MSLPVLVKDLSAQQLTKARLQMVWEHHNLKNKSPLIDPLVKAFFDALEEKGRKDDAEDPSFSPEEVAIMCTNFQNKVVRAKITPVDVLLEPIPGKAQGIQSGWRYNPPTGIVFYQREMKTGPRWVAIHVFAGGRIYPLGRKHMIICVSNGWFFETTDTSISCAFKMKPLKAQ